MSPTSLDGSRARRLASTLGSRARLVACALLFACLPSACDDGSDSHGDVDQSAPDNVSALIDQKGGTLHASGVTVDIPEGALKSKVMISVTKSTESANTAKTKSKVVSDVYEFGPAGTQFDKDVKVSFHVAVDDEKDADKVAVYFTKEADGTTFEQISTEKDEKNSVASAKVRHFSSGFAGIPLGADAGSEPDDAGLTMDAGTMADASTGADSGTVPKGTSIVVNTHDLDGVSVNLNWAAYQDGDGAWQPLAVSGATGVYEFRVTSSRYAVAFVCGTPGAASYGTINYEPTTTTALDVTTNGTNCNKAPAVIDGVTGTVALQSGDGYIRFGSPYVDNYTEPNAGAYSAWSMAARNVPTDLMYGSATYYYKGLTAFTIVRDFVSSADPSSVNVDLSSGKSLVGSNAQVTVTNTEYTLYNIPVEYGTKGATTGMSLVNGDVTGTGSSYSVPYATIPESARVSSDRYVVNVSENGTTDRTTLTTFYASGNISVALPADFNATLSVPNASDAGYMYPPSSDAGVGTRFFPLYTFSAYAGATSYLLDWNYSEYSGGRHHGFDIRFDPAWFEGDASADYSFPDLTSVNGFDPQWLPPAVNDLGYGALEITAAAVHEDTTAEGVYTKTTSTVDYYYPFRPD